MEACGAAHHWARLLTSLGHHVKLIAPEAVRPFVKKGKKNDAADAAALCEAATRPDMKFVPTKTADQQAILAFHSARSLLIKQQTMLVNAMRGLATEFGLTVPKGISRLGDLTALVDADEAFPETARGVFTELHQQFDSLAEVIDTIETKIVAHARGDETARRLATIPGIGPITASLIAATVADISVFKSARYFAAWFGLVPRQYSTGGKTRLGRITKAGKPGDPEVAGPRCHVDGSPGGAMEQRGRGMDPRRSATASCQAGDGGAGKQDGAHRLGVDDARRGLPKVKGSRSWPMASCDGSGARWWASGASPIDPAAGADRREGRTVTVPQFRRHRARVRASSTPARLVPDTRAYIHHGQR